jgi:membrane-bound lytic murein transglycosylase B
VIGTSNVFNALYTLAFNYPPRAERFRSELTEFLLLTRELNTDPLQIKGSYAGALGVPQFLPSSYRRYAVDFDGDGKRDLWNHADAIGSIANYYKSHGWLPGEPVLAQIEQSADPISDEFKALVERGINPQTTVAAIKRAGGSPAYIVADDMKAAVFAAETDAGTRHWIGFNNFYVITRYNRSVNYALAVYELAQELRGLRTAQRAE